MALVDLFFPKSDAAKHGRKAPPLDPAKAARIAVMDDNTRALHQTFLPRGVELIRPHANREPAARWATQREMADLHMPRPLRPDEREPLPLGSFRNQLIGYNDDRAMITLAAARAGKSSTVLEPCLLTYTGSMLVFDPKGELATATAKHRQKVLGQTVHVIDPYGVTGLGSASFNILDELDLKSRTVVDDAYKLAQTIVVADEGRDDSNFWTEGGRELLTGLILSVLQMPPEHRHLVTVRQLLTGAHPAIRAKVAERKFTSAAKRAEYMENLLLGEMARPPRTAVDCDPRIVDLIMGIGDSYLAMPDRMRGSMLSTARQATRFLDSLVMADISTASHFRLADLRHSRATIYLILPGGSEIRANFRWLRMIFEMAASSLQKLGPYPRTEPPMIFMMEEFPVLGRLEVIEASAAFLPGFGVKLHLVAQNLSQIQTAYPANWQTFFNNAGVIQCFANNNDADLEFISNWLGRITFEREKPQFSKAGEDSRVTVPLLAPDEIRRLFARQYNDQILLIPGHQPYAVNRLTHEEVKQLRRNVTAGQVSIEGAKGHKAFGSTEAELTADGLLGAPEPEEDELLAL